MASLDLSAPKLIQNLIVRVRGVDAVAWRFWLSTPFWRLAARIAGCKVEIDLAKRAES